MDVRSKQKGKHKLDDYWIETGSESMQIKTTKVDQVDTSSNGKHISKAVKLSSKNTADSEDNEDKDCVEDLMMNVNITELFGTSSTCEDAISWSELIKIPNSLGRIKASRISGVINLEHFGRMGKAVKRDRSGSVSPNMILKKRHKSGTINNKKCICFDDDPDHNNNTKIGHEHIHVLTDLIKTEDTSQHFDTNDAVYNQHDKANTDWQYCKHAENMKAISVVLSSGQDFLQKDRIKEDSKSMTKVHSRNKIMTKVIKKEKSSSDPISSNNKQLMRENDSCTVLTKLASVNMTNDCQLKLEPVSLDVKNDIRMVCPEPTNNQQSESISKKQQSKCRLASPNKELAISKQMATDSVQSKSEPTISKKEQSKYEPASLNMKKSDSSRSTSVAGLVSTKNQVSKSEPVSLDVKESENDIRIVCPEQTNNQQSGSILNKQQSKYRLASPNKELAKSKQMATNRQLSKSEPAISKKNRSKSKPASSNKQQSNSEPTSLKVKQSDSSSSTSVAKLVSTKNQMSESEQVSSKQQSKSELAAATKQLVKQTSTNSRQSKYEPAPSNMAKIEKFSSDKKMSKSKISKSNKQNSKSEQSPSNKQYDIIQSVSVNKKNAKSESASLDVKQSENDSSVYTKRAKLSSTSNQKSQQASDKPLSKPEIALIKPVLKSEPASDKPILKPEPDSSNKKQTKSQPASTNKLKIKSETASANKLPVKIKSEPTSSDRQQLKSKEYVSSKQQIKSELALSSQPSKSDAEKLKNQLVAIHSDGTWKKIASVSPSRRASVKQQEKTERKAEKTVKNAESLKEACEKQTVQKSKTEVKIEAVRKYFCDLCDVKASSDKDLQTHINGRKHRLKENKFHENKNPINKEQKNESETRQNSYNDSKTTSKSLVQSSCSSTKQEKTVNTNNTKATTQFFCRLCSTEFKNAVNLKNHNRSRCHTEKMYHLDFYLINKEKAPSYYENIMSTPRHIPTRQPHMETLGHTPRKDLRYVDNVVAFNNRSLYSRLEEHQFFVPQYLYPSLVGGNDSNRKYIEAMTGVRIRFESLSYTDRFYLCKINGTLSEIENAQWYLETHFPEMFW